MTSNIQNKYNIPIKPRRKANRDIQIQEKENKKERKRNY